MDGIIHEKGKIYYTMGEVTELFGVNASLLRYWEQEFDMLRPHRNKKGNRLYTPQDVDLIKSIYHLVKEKKMKIEIARKHLKNNKKEVDRDAAIVEKLMSIRAILQEIKNDLAYDGQIVDAEEYPANGRRDAVADVTPAANPRQKNVHAAAPKPETAGEDAKEAQVPAFEEQTLFSIREAGSPETDIPTQAVPPADNDGEDATADDPKQHIIEQTLF